MSDELDKKDIEILKRLKNDSRIPMGVIGDQIGIS
ncbi:MAG: Lrp/AsnC family transcriptional regulator, partial [Candidatus Methanomethylophilaceae archaeon]|nr:Lrp/AsnC family transcriptional regulator [Candidatus Methanomethylophilaceae archaeon]